MRKNLTPYFRPDAVSGEDEPDGLDWMPETPIEPCPCCGAELPENPSWGISAPCAAGRLITMSKASRISRATRIMGCRSPRRSGTFIRSVRSLPWKVMEN